MPHDPAAFVCRSYSLIMVDPQRLGLGVQAGWLGRRPCLSQHCARTVGFSDGPPATGDAHRGSQPRSRLNVARIGPLQLPGSEEGVHPVDVLRCTSGRGADSSFLKCLFGRHLAPSAHMGPSGYESCRSMRPDAPRKPRHPSAACLGARIKADGGLHGHVPSTILSSWEGAGKPTRSHLPDGIRPAQDSQGGPRRCCPPGDGVGPVAIPWPFYGISTHRPCLALSSTASQTRCVRNADFISGWNAGPPSRLAKKSAKLLMNVCS